MKSILFLLLGCSVSLWAESQAFNQVLKNYEGLHKAFFENNFPEVKKQAQRVLESVSNIDDPKISQTLEYSKTKLNLILEAKSIDSAKHEFDVVSRAFVVVLQKHAPNKTYSRFYCPMEQKYWIQNTSESITVLNPYASETMPNCGSIK